jgi:hypothetical protein
VTFSDDVLRKAWERAGGKCECRARTHAHGFRTCDELLSWDKQGQPGPGGWWPHATAGDTGDNTALSHCEIICWDCYLQTDR